MSISWEEKLNLSIYLELFNRCYNLNDERKYSVNQNILVRHIEMHNISFLLQSLGIASKYYFTWNYRYPYSPGLESMLNDMDKKKTDVKSFYEHYNKKRAEYFSNYKQQLTDLLCYLGKFEESEIKRIYMASIVLNDIFKEKNGSEILATIIYLIKNVYPGENLSMIMPKLNEYGYLNQEQLAEKIWKDLAILEIREVAVKKLQI